MADEHTLAYEVDTEHGEGRSKELPSLIPDSQNACRHEESAERIPAARVDDDAA